MAIDQHKGIGSDGLKRRGRPTQVGSRDIPAETIAVARELFAIYGFESVSISAIAQRVGVSPTTINHHFTDKVELWKRVHTVTSGAVWPHLRAELDDRPLRDIILAVARRSIEVRKEFPYFTEFLFRATQESAIHPVISTTIMNRRENRLAFFTSLADLGASRGEFIEGITRDFALSHLRLTITGFLEEAFTLPDEATSLIRNLDESLLLLLKNHPLGTK